MITFFKKFLHNKQKKKLSKAKKNPGIKEKSSRLLKAAP
jgi:hypothetical protein